MVGIYKITNLVNGKVYIGQSTDIHRRIIVHKSRAFQENDAQRDCHLYRAIRKYGVQNFEFEVVEECPVSELNAKEILYIDMYKSYDEEYGYNMTRGGEGGYKQSRPFIIGLWKDGFSVGEIAKEIHGSRNTVKDVLKEYDLYSEEESRKRGNESRGIKINQYTLDYEYITTWPSFREAVRQTNIDRHSISDCCKGELSQAGGYKWEYAAAMADLLD